MRCRNVTRSGITLTELLIAIMIMGIGFVARRGSGFAVDPAGRVGHVGG
mgnify:CR=1 FL=1